MPIDVEKMNIDLLAFQVIKGFLVTGTAGLYVREVIIKPLVQGSTGSFSDRLVQPEIFPTFSAALNVPGIVDLSNYFIYK